MRNKGEPYPPGTYFGLRYVLRVVERKKPINMTLYEVQCTCGHTTIRTHKTLVDVRSHHTGLCTDCLGLDRGKKAAAINRIPKDQRAAPKPPPPHANRELILWAHRLWRLP